MKQEVKEVLKFSMKYDLILLISIATITAILFNIVYALIYILGLVISMLNFFINAVLIDYQLNKKGEKLPILSVISFIVRTVVICAIAMIVFTYNRYYLIVYIIGVISHFISIILYAIKLRKN